MIMDLVDLQQRNWVPKNKVCLAPKTKEEVHREAELERQQREMAKRAEV